MLKCAASIILKLSLKTLLKWKIHLSSPFFINCYNFNKEICVGRRKMGNFFQKHDKFCSVVSKSAASLHLCSVRRGIFRGRWKMIVWLNHESVTQKTGKHESLATRFHRDIWQFSYSPFQSALLFETGVPCRGIVRVKVMKAL